MNFLIATNDTAFLDEATSIIEKKLPQIKKIQDVLEQADVLKKVAQNKYEYILIDFNSCPVESVVLSKLIKLSATKIKISSQNYADIPTDFFKQKSMQILNMNYASISAGLNELILNDKDHFWGEDIKQLTLYKNEVLCREGSVGDAIFLIKEGFLQREFPDGRILDGSIGAGKMIGELAYFNREPRKWKIVASEQCTLIRIAYRKVDQQIEKQPSWIKVMFTSLAERSLKYVDKA